VSPDEDVGTVPNLVDIVGSPNGEVLSVLIDKRGQFSPTKPGRRASMARVVRRREEPQPLAAFPRSAPGTSGDR